MSECNIFQLRKNINHYEIIKHRLIIHLIIYNIYLIIGKYYPVIFNIIIIRLMPYL